MTASVTCPNPKCLHNKKAFKVTLQSPIAKAGGNARWKNMSPRQRKLHIARMTKARIGSSKKRK